MQLDIVKFRNLCHLSGRKIIFTLAFCVCVLTAQAQIQGKSYNYLDFQKKPYYFGITFGFNNSGYKINHSPNFIDNKDDVDLDKSIFIAEGASGTGLEVHMVTNLKIGEYFDFRFIPGVSLVERTFEFKDNLDQLAIAKIESVFVDVPFQIRYKSAPYKDKRAFVAAGMKYTYDVQSNSKTQQANSLIKITPHDFQAEVAVGFQIFLPYIIVSPELKFSQGINNILIYNDNINQARIFEKVLSRVFTFSVHLEG